MKKSVGTRGEDQNGERAVKKMRSEGDALYLPQFVLAVSSRASSVKWSKGLTWTDRFSVNT